jgi:hypothetical protein
MTTTRVSRAPVRALGGLLVLAGACADERPVGPAAAPSLARAAVTALADGPQRVDRVADNVAKFQITESECLPFGKGP